MTLWMSDLPFETDAGFGSRARIGLVVLATDYTIEREYQAVVNRLDGVAFYAARIPMDPIVTPQSLTAMGVEIPRTAGLILPDDRVDVIAYGCSSATALLGEDKVSELVQGVKPGTIVTTPITAAKAALGALGVRRLGVLTPYTADVNHGIKAAFEAAGFEMPVFGSFDEPRDKVVASISEASIRQQARALTGAAEIDGLFISCTSLRGLGVSPVLENELGIPVTASNHAMIWHSLRLAGIDDRLDGLGQLYTLAI
ncbi:MAG: Asp/Glu racemase [Pseudomonadota bacterium]